VIHDKKSCGNLAIFVSGSSQFPRSGLHHNQFPEKSNLWIADRAMQHPGPMPPYAQAGAAPELTGSQKKPAPATGMADISTLMIRNRSLIKFLPLQARLLVCEGILSGKNTRP